MRKTLISVIIPVFNCERYLPECLDSVISQTLQDVEIILINDSSTDSSQEIIDKYGLSDSRIRPVELEENRGVGYARNTGIEMAEGEFIIFLDADDYWDDDRMLESLYETAINDKADLVKFGYYKLDSAGQRVIHQVDKPRTVKLRSGKDWSFSYSPWSLLIARKLVIENDIRFDPRLLIGEDSLFNCTLYCHASTLTYLDKVFYCYRFERDGCASVGDWTSHRIKCTVLWFRSAIEVITGSGLNRTHPHLLQLMLCERLAKLTNRFAKVAIEVLNENQLKEYIHEWSICLGYLDKNFLEKVGFSNRKVFPGVTTDRYRNILAVVLAEDIDGLHKMFDIPAARQGNGKNS